MIPHRGLAYHGRLIETEGLDAEDRLRLYQPAGGRAVAERPWESPDATEPRIQGTATPGQLEARPHIPKDAQAAMSCWCGREVLSWPVSAIGESAPSCGRPRCELLATSAPYRRAQYGVN